MSNTPSECFLIYAFTMPVYSLNTAIFCLAKSILINLKGKVHYQKKYKTVNTTFVYNDEPLYKKKIFKLIDTTAKSITIKVIVITQFKQLFILYAINSGGNKPLKLT